MARYFLALEFPDKALSALKKMHRPIAGVTWYGADAFVERGWAEWGLLPLCDLLGSEEKIEAMDADLRPISLPAFTISMKRLTFWVADDVTDICLRVEPSPALERLLSTCLQVAATAGVEASAFEPLAGIGQTHEASRETLEAYAAIVEPIAPVAARFDKLLLCERIYPGLKDGRFRQYQAKRHVLFEYPLQAG